jgi:hypothetical protein
LPSGIENLPADYEADTHAIVVEYVVHDQLCISMVPAADPALIGRE